MLSVSALTPRRPGPLMDSRSTGEQVRDFERLLSIVPAPDSAPSVSAIIYKFLSRPDLHPEVRALGHLTLCDLWAAAGSLNSLDRYLHAEKAYRLARRARDGDLAARAQEHMRAVVLDAEVRAFLRRLHS